MHLFAPESLGGTTPTGYSFMQLNQFVSRIASITGLEDSVDVLRLCFLVANQVGDLNSLRENTDESLESCCRRVILQLQMAIDQNQAVSEELDLIADTEACEFTPDHVWTLVRAIKTQSSLLQLYQGGVSSPSELP